jgi:D-alanyl-D-alanine carboxypeptidase/D-alanyl-D-alanine-endopeptidase (penicillin-binding protein 4)
MTTDLRDAKSSRINGRRFSRRRALGYGGGLAGALAFAGTKAAGAQATPIAAASDDLAAAVAGILADPRYAPSRLGIHVADRETGEALLDIRGDEWFLAASTTKLFSGAAALDAYGPDFQFETPVYRLGSVGADGTLDGDLMLVASADLTMGGRDTEDGDIAFTPIDHINAVAFPALATLTPQDPLAGLDDLANQVAAAGITRVTGDVLIDDRLFEAMPKDEYILTPVWINDNLIDLSLTPGAVGEAATLEWRPMSAAYEIDLDVQTVAAGEAPNVTVSSPSPGKIRMEGTLPEDQANWVQVYQVEDPSAHARTLFIEALERAGVTVTASATGKNPVEKLPQDGALGQADRVALHRSLPFSKNLKLIEKVSHNQHADMLIMLLALHVGVTSFDEGMLQVRVFLEKSELESASVSLSDGRGNEYTDLFSPSTVGRLLAHMSIRADFDAYYDALPIMGVDGTEATTVAPDSPVAGNARAKSGMTIAGDGANDRAVVMTRALAGYMTGKSGREVVFGIYLNNVPLASLDDVFPVITEHGAITEAIFERV